MKRSSLLLFLAVFFFGITNIYAQVPEGAGTTGKTESSDPEESGKPKPLDGIIEKKMILEKKVLPFISVRENDLYWEKKVWRVIDVREKMNLPFMNPEKPFLTILTDAAQKGEITVYSNENDKFTAPLKSEEIASIISSIDTTTTVDPETYEEKQKITRNDLNPEDIKQFRVKEIWYFDAQHSTLKVRILGIAPIRDNFDKKTGNFLYRGPMFWIYYPDCRELLAKHQCFNVSGNDASPMSWEDILEMRYFSSYLYKESNVHNRTLDVPYPNGPDMLMEGEKIKNDVFNFEHDMWSY